MKLFLTSQIRQLDAITIEREPIASIDLMERAAMELSAWVASNIHPPKPLLVFAGAGNNGGDGVAMARILCRWGFSTNLYVLRTGSAFSPDMAQNIKRVEEQGVLTIRYLEKGDDFPLIPDDAVVVDALFGSGLSRPVEGIAAHLIAHINASGASILSIDIPSGLFGEENPYPNPNPVIKATDTLTLQFPKLSFFIAENSESVGNWHVIPIGLHAEAIEQTPSPYYYVDKDTVREWIPKRSRFMHKGHFGHCLMVVGSKGMMGAAILSARACLRSGVGLVTAHAPRVGYSIMQQSVPEAMVSEDPNDSYFSELPDLKPYSAIGVGPGLGQSPESLRALQHLISAAHCPMLLDADALNLMASVEGLPQQLPPNSILTPHPGEFQRLFGDTKSGYNQLKLAIEQAQRLGVTIVLKGAYTRTVAPNGEVYFNSTGNPGMATGGSGDVLTGIISGLLAQGVGSVRAAALGAFLHGLAADIAANGVGEQSLIASDIVDCLPKAFKSIS